MKKEIPAWLVLLVICLVAGLALGLTNALTVTPIAVNAEREAEQTRRSLFGAADTFEPVALAPDSGLDSCYAAYQGDALEGYLARITVQGFGGPIEVQAGMDMDGHLTGVSVGGPDFAETPGLGAKTMEAAFTGQFAKKTIPVQLGQDVDAVTGATISSSAVIGAVNKVGSYLDGLMHPAAAEAAEDLQFGGILPGATTKHEETPPAGIDALYSSDAGCVAYVTRPGRNGPITVHVGVANSGQVAGVSVDPAHAETDGVGTLIEESYFLNQYIGHGEGVVLGETIDGVSGATVSAAAVTEAVNAAIEAAKPYLDPSKAVDIAPVDGGAPVSAASAGQKPQVVQTGTGVTVKTAREWAEQYPEIFASYQKNAENSAVIQHTEEYPMIRAIYEGMAFNKFYGSARGHVYTVEDVTATGRPHALANCFSCKTPDFTAKVNELGDAAYAIPFDEMLADVREPISCYNCHANADGELVVTHTYLSDAMGDDLQNVAAATLSCGQCHVEYYFAPDTKATTLPYSSLSVMNPDDILAYYNETLLVEGKPFADYTNPRTGVRQIKVQHPEFETYLGVGGVHKDAFTCADCHMGEAEAADGSAYTSHYWISPLQNPSLVENTCSACHDDLSADVAAIQAEAERRTIAIGYQLEFLTERLAAAVADGAYTDEELDAIRDVARDAQFYWDFVFVENSEGAHNSALTRQCLDKAEALTNTALGMFH